MFKVLHVRFEKILLLVAALVNSFFSWGLIVMVVQAVLWYTENLKPKTSLEEHTSMITDVRFSPSMPRLATSSFDRTVRVWDADNVSYPLSMSSI